MRFRAGPFVLCKDGCCHQRRRNTNFGPENFFHEKIFPHICVVKMISAPGVALGAMFTAPCLHEHGSSHRSRCTPAEHPHPNP